MRTLKGYLLLGTALVACPCHLPLTLGLLAGTSLGGFVAENLALVAAGLTGYFILALVLGLRWLGRVPARTAAAASGPGGGDADPCDQCSEVIAGAAPNKAPAQFRR